MPNVLLSGGCAEQPALSELPLGIVLRGTTVERINTIEAMLRSPAGPSFRRQTAEWLVQFLPVQRLVPEIYARWRPLVRDAMLFTASFLSAARLAPKLVEQVDLPPGTPAEDRLLRLIAKVPGLQKLGQVLARNRHLHPALRHALSQLENGIRDVTADAMLAIVHAELQPRLDACGVRVQPKILSEASVSAVMRFTWRPPESRRRERGVFKILKPYIPEYYAEDMELLAQLAKFLTSRRRLYGFSSPVLPDTFRKVRQLLHHEINFRREQVTLGEAARLYSGVRGVRVPRVITPLSTPKITALSQERGSKITAIRMSPAQRRHIAEQVVEAVVATPLFSSEARAMFHADPHAGNLLYDRNTGELVILDWALTEHLTRQQRRYLVLLFLMLALRDPYGVCHALQCLSDPPKKGARRQANILRHFVLQFMQQLPLARVPDAVDAMRLVERVALQGVHFPASLLMLRKVLFTLDGILHDLAGPDTAMDLVIARHALRCWRRNVSRFGWPLTLADLILAPGSAMAYLAHIYLHGAQGACERVLGRLHRHEVGSRPRLAAA